LLSADIARSLIVKKYQCQFAIAALGPLVVGARKRVHEFERSAVYRYAEHVSITRSSRGRVSRSAHELAPGADAAAPPPGAGVEIPESPLFEHATHPNTSVAIPTHLIHLADMINLRLL